ncbi:hypothetical protein FALCPG4_011090 [Fusarium falciforme]
MPIFKVNAITYQNDPVLPICITGRAPEENAGLPIKMLWNPFESHCTWFVLQVDRTKLRDMKTTMEAFCNKVGHAVFSFKPGLYIPTVYLVGDGIDPPNFKDVVWAAVTRCQPRTNEFFFDEYPKIPLIPYVCYGVKSDRNAWKVVRCCLFPSEFEHDQLMWREASFRRNYPDET